ncbi:CHAT domain-containing protein [Fischerella sp. PCC 9605]|uniref:CHAT domain-containing protein n=1 Tax=Fischerella sp. PCC 9605 TaxID=1173024 RepID=UPI00047DB271|nr:CHAT domain-containing protein [Fischerella sp. PCC 9605]
MLSRHRTSSVGRLLQFLFVCSFTCSLFIGHLPLSPWQRIFRGNVTAQTIVKNSHNPSRLVSSDDTNQRLYQGIKKYKKGDFTNAIAPWQTTLNTSKQNDNNVSKTSIIENLTRLYQEIGKTEEEIAYWEEAIAYYSQAHEWLNVGQMLTQQAQAYNSLGKPNQAMLLSQSALQIARIYNDDGLEAAALVSRGEAYRLEGNYKQAITDLQSSIKIAVEIHNLTYHASALNKLGNTYINLAQLGYSRAKSTADAGDHDEAEIWKKQALENDLLALQYFQKSLEIARQRQDKLSEIRLLISSIPPTHRIKKSHLVTTKLQLALLLLERLPNSPSKVYAAIQLAHFLQSLPSKATFSLTECPTPQRESQALDLLNRAVSIAQDLQDDRALSFAFGYLGHIYECRQDYKQALKLTHQAQQAAEKQLNTQDSFYLWDWQVGRILRAQNRVDEAIAAYEQAVANLENIHTQIVVANPDLQPDPRDTLERIYRELIALKLSVDNPETASSHLNSAIASLDALKLAELRNYFRNDFVVRTVNQDKANLLGSNTLTAVFWSIIFEDRTAIIVCLPNGEVKLKWINLNNQSLKDEINKFRIGLERRSDIIYNRREAQKLYDWIVRPFTDDLDSLQVKTLVFIPDGILRSVPMAALHDGKRFLIEKYAIASTPSMSLTDPFKAKPEKLRALAVGLTEDAMVDGREYQALTNVKQEINQVLTLIPGSKQLLDRNFTRDRLQAELQQTVYPIIHIATHGEFGIVPEDTFLVTGNNHKLTINDLYSIVNNAVSNVNSVDLLSLTACETARGDDRATLGLASVAVVAGVKSTLASLWSVNDAATVILVTKFYEYWHNQGASKAEALQRAQQELIALGKKYAHPYYWAPFILLGNWL